MLRRIAGSSSSALVASSTAVVASTSCCGPTTSCSTATADCCATQTRQMHGAPRRKTNIRGQHNRYWYAKAKNHLLTGREAVNTLDRPGFNSHAEDVDRPMVIPNDAKCFACSKDFSDLHTHAKSAHTDVVWIPSGNAAEPGPQGYFFCKSCFRCDQCKFRFVHNKFYTVKGKALCVRCALGREVRVPGRRWHDSFVGGYNVSSRITGQAFPRYKHELEFLYNPEK